MTNSPYGFGFPADGDILSKCIGKGDRAVYARATLDNHLYLETNGGPIELAGEEDFLDASYDDKATIAILSLAFELVLADRGDLASYIADNLSLVGLDDLSLRIKCLIEHSGIKLAQKI